MKNDVLAHHCGPKGADWRFLVGLAALLAGCGSASSEPLLQNAVLLESPELPEGGIFGTAFALEGDLLAVNAMRNAPVPEPGTWEGATTIYRKVDGRWLLEDTLQSPAKWMIESAVHIIDGQVLMIAPFDGQCVGPNGEPVPQSGSIYAFSWSGQQWGPPEQICAPNPQGGGALGWSSARTQGGLLMASNPQNEAPSLVRLTQASGWRTSTELSLPRSDLSFGLVAYGGRVMRIHRGSQGFEVEVRDAGDLTQVTRRVPCSDPTETCRAWPLSYNRVLLAQHDGAEIVDANGVRTLLNLAGAGEHFEITGYGETAALLDDLGQLFLIEDPVPDQPISPVLTEFCAEGIANVGLFDGSVVLSCRGSEDVWVVPLDR